MTIIRTNDPTERAREIVTDPALFGRLPLAIVQAAWATLKQARGQSVDPHRTGPAAPAAAPEQRP